MYVSRLVRYKLLYKQLALGIGNGEFRPPHLENRSTDFDETWNLELSPEDHPAYKITHRCVNVGGLREHPVCHCRFLSSPFFFLSFLVPSARAQVALDRSPPKSPCKRGSGQGWAFWRSRWWPIMFRGSDPKHQNFGGVSCISSQICKQIKSPYFQTMHRISIKFDRLLWPVEKISWMVLYDDATNPIWRTVAILDFDLML